MKIKNKHATLLFLITLGGSLNAFAAPATEAEIAELYRSVLGREPDAEGAAWWKNSGGSPEEVKKGFLESVEYKTKSAGTSAPIVNNAPATNNPVTIPASRAQVSQLYRDLLGREPDQSGLDFWVKSGHSIDSIEAEFRESDEYKTKQLTAKAEAEKPILGYVNCSEIRYDYKNTSVVNLVTTNGIKITTENYKPGMICYSESSVGTLLPGGTLHDPLFDDVDRRREALVAEWIKYRETLGDLNDPKEYAKFSAAQKVQGEKEMALAEERKLLQSKRNFHSLNGYNIGSTPGSIEPFNPNAVAPKTPPPGWVGYYNPEHPDWTLDPKEYFKNMPNILSSLDNPGDQVGAAIQTQNYYYERLVTSAKFRKDSDEQSKKCAAMLPADPQANFPEYVRILESAEYKACVQKNIDAFAEWQEVDDRLLKLEIVQNGGTLPTVLDQSEKVAAKGVELPKVASKTNVSMCTFDLKTDLEKSIGTIDQSIAIKIDADVLAANHEMTAACKSLAHITDDSSGLKSSALMSDLTRNIADLSNKVAYHYGAVANQAIPLVGKLKSLPTTVNAKSNAAAVSFMKSAETSNAQYHQAIGFAEHHKSIVDTLGTEDSKKLDKDANRRIARLKTMSEKLPYFRFRPMNPETLASHQAQEMASVKQSDTNSNNREVKTATREPASKKVKHGKKRFSVNLLEDAAIDAKRMLDSK